MKNLVLNKLIFLISPFGIFIFIRIFLPSIWIFEYLNSPEKNDKDVVFFHLFYLFFLLLGFYILYRLFNKYQNIVFSKQSPLCINNNKNYSIFFLFVMSFGIFINSSVPLFQEGGSDAIVLMQNDSFASKTSTWFYSGTLLTLSYPIYFLFFIEHSKVKKMFYFLFLIFISISSGKKAGLLDFLSTFLFVASFYMIFKNIINFKKFLIVSILSFLTLFFAFIQFSRTVGLDFLSISFIEMLFFLIDLTKNSFSSYLEQIHNLGGFEYISLYSHQLGDFGWFKYFFNSFIKIFNPNGGIQKSIGPFLNLYIYGSEIPNGVNPTLYYELIFISGKKYFGILSFAIIIPIFFILFRLFNLIYIKARTLDIFSLSIYLFFIKFLLFFLNDTLNAIRTLPFILILFFFKYFRKLKF